MKYCHTCRAECGGHYFIVGGNVYCPNCCEEVIAALESKTPEYKSLPVPPTSFRTRTIVSRVSHALHERQRSTKGRLGRQLGLTPQQVYRALRTLRQRGIAEPAILGNTWLWLKH